MATLRRLRAWTSPWFDRHTAHGGGSLRARLFAIAWTLGLLAGCGGDTPPASDAARDARRDPTVTMRGEDAALVPAWQPPPVEIDEGGIDAVREEAAAALAAGRLHGEPRSAMPLLLELREQAPADAEIQALFDQALADV